MAGSDGKKRNGEARTEELDSVVVRFVGDSGDGMQLTGTEFTRASALFGNDIATFPDFPAEIRAPAGSLAGVSGFQLQFSSANIFTAGDAPDVLVAMNPAALKTNIADLLSGGLLLVDSSAFKKRNLELAGYEKSPLEDGSLSAFRVIEMDFSKHVSAALKGSGLSTKDVQRTRNMFALGVVFWLYNRDAQTEVAAIREKFARRPEIAEANAKAFMTGFHFGETTELFDANYRVPPAELAPGAYRSVTGNEAAAIGIVAAGKLAGLRILYASYPITPASDILHYLSGCARYGVTTFQAEDEIAAVTAAIGASFGGLLAVTSTSGPGLTLKQEGIALAVVTELPLLIIDVQRAGPSTGMPTKPEQGDLLQALGGRNSDCPVAVVAPATPADCFDIVVEAARLAIEHMTPVICLSDASLANSAEPWLLPNPDYLEPIRAEHREDPEGFQPFLRDENFVRPWAVPGTPGLEHRIGGLEKEDVTGGVSYDPKNHEHMVRVRKAKIERIASRIPLAEVEGPDTGDVLLIGWGGTYGALHQAASALREEGAQVAHLHLRYLNPLQANVGEILSGYQHVVVAELNSGQLRSMLRDRFLVDAQGLNKVRGQPFKVREIVEAVRSLLPARAVREARV